MHMSYAGALRASLIFIAKWAVAGLVFALVLVWIRPDLRQSAAAVVPERVPDSRAPIVVPQNTATPVPAKPGYADAVAKSAPSVVNIYTARVVARPAYDSPRSYTNR